MNGKLWPTLLAVIIAGQSAWLLSLEIRKESKELVTDRWTGAQQVEYKIYVEARLDEIKEIKDIIIKLDQKIDKLLNERGTDSRGSERE